MAHLKINKRLESTGGNSINLERSTLNERAPAANKLIVFLAPNKKNKEYPVQSNRSRC